MRSEMDGQVLTAGTVERFLSHKELRVQVEERVSSTNTVLKARAEEGALEGTVLIAREQTAGRGRLGRSFFSPMGTGLYLSVILRPRLPLRKTVRITTGAAVAVAEAIEAVTGEPAQIKWVNDIVRCGKKVCGILTEAAVDGGTGDVRYAILGIGLNLSPPDGGFPEPLRAIAGALLEPGQSDPEFCGKLAAAILDRFFDRYGELESEALYEAYRDRCFLLGKEIWVHREDGKVPALAQELDRDFGLVVRLKTGQVQTLAAGEVTIRERTLEECGETGGTV